MPYTTDPAERAALDGVQLALDQLVRMLMDLEAAGPLDALARLRLSSTIGQRCADYLRRARDFAERTAVSGEFLAELRELAELTYDLVVSFAPPVDWDAELAELTGGAA